MKVSTASLLSNLKPSNLRDSLFYVLLFVLPTQLGYHFWPSFSLILGRRIDYLSPTIFLQDVLLLFLCLLIVHSGKIMVPRLSLKTSGLLVALILFSCGSIFFSSQPLLSLYGWLRILELFLFWGVLRFFSWPLPRLLQPLTIGIILIVFIALAQFLQQSSLDGLFYFVGERHFTIDTPAIARMQTQGRLLLRPYSTFPHPNALAGYLVCMLPLLYLLKPKNSFEYRLRVIGLCAALLGIGISFSRTSWLVSGLLFLLILFRSWKKTAFTALLLLLLIIIEEFTFGRISSLLGSDSVSLSQRIALSHIALRQWSSSPVLGSGALSFIPLIPKFVSPPYLLQPVHSVYLLALSEFGLIGSFVFALLIVSALYNSFSTHSPVFFSVCGFLLLGLFDHYFFTILQTRLLLTLLLSYAVLLPTVRPLK